MKDRAIQDPAVLLYAPLASSGTGPLFPGVMSAIVDADEALREKLTYFKGPKQLYVAEEGTQDSYSNRTRYYPKSGPWILLVLGMLMTHQENVPLLDIQIQICFI